MGEDILAWGATDAFAGRLLAAVDARLGAQNPLRTERYGAKIDATILERPSGEKFLFLVNWEDRPATVDLSVAAADGTYEMLGRDENGWYAAGPGKRTTVSAKDLRSFRLTLAPRKAFFFVIRGRR